MIPNGKSTRWWSIFGPKIDVKIKDSLKDFINAGQYSQISIYPKDLN